MKPKIYILNDMGKIKYALEFSFIIVLLVSGMLGMVFSVKAYPKIFETQIIIENRDKILDPEDPVIMSFSDPMIVESVESEISISPETGVGYVWENSNKKLIITPKTSWKPGTTYNLNIGRGRNIMLIESGGSFSFSTTPYPKVQSFTPKRGAKDVVIDIEDPIEISFDKPLSKFQVKFLTDPKEALAYQLDKDSPKIELMPKGKLEEGREYSIEVYVKYSKESGDDYEKIYSTSFETKLSPPDPKSDDFESRLAYAKKYTQPRIEEGKYIDIDVKNQIMMIFEEGKPLDSFLISSGKRGMDTPQGSFQIHNKHPKPWSRKYSLYMPYWMAIVGSGLYGIHELPEWPGGYKEGQDHLGTPVSHGCVRLGVGSAKRVYAWADIGTPVIIHD